MKILNLLTLLFLIFIVNTKIVFAQSKSSFEVNFAPTISYRTLDQNYASHDIGLRFDAGFSFIYSLKPTIKLAKLYLSLTFLAAGDVEI